MPMNVVYRGPGDLPHVIPVFPLPGALLLPRGQMPLNIFEPRYLAMVDDAMADRHRLIGMIQPDTAHPGPEDKPRALQDRLRRPHHPARRDRRRALPDRAHRRRAFPRRGGADGADPLSSVPCRLLPSRTIFGAQGRGRSRPRRAAQGAVELPQGQQAQRRLGRHREGAERGAGERARHDVALWGGRKAGDAGSAGPEDARRDPGGADRDRAGQGENAARRSCSSRRH